MTIGKWLKQAELKLEKSGVDTARLDAQVIAGHMMKHDKSWLLAHHEQELDKHDEDELNKLLERRTKREPLAYILRHKEFYGLNFEVTPSVLIPRPETEIIVETAADNAPQGGQVLEIGTGSGAITVALKHIRPDLVLTATDISATALKVARKNARQHKLDIRFVKSNLFESIVGRFDLILANLPYVPTGTRRQPELAFEPGLALYAGQDGLDYYRRFIKRLPKHLNLNGQAVIEAGPTQRAELIRLAEATGLKLQSVSEYVSILK